MRLALPTILVLFAATAAHALTDDLQCYKVGNESLKALKVVVDLDAPAIGAAPGCKLTKAKLYCVPSATTVQPGTLFDGRQPLTTIPYASMPAETARICYGVSCKKPNGLGPDQTATDRFGTHGFGKLAAQMVCVPAIAGTIAPPAQGFQIASPDVEIQPGQEIDYCYYFRTPNQQAVAVRKWASSMSAVILDAALYATPTDEQSAGTISAAGCGGLGTASVQNLPRWLYSTDTATAELTFPTDDGTGSPVAFELPPNQPAYVLLHYRNDGAEPVRGHFTLNAEVLDGATAFTHTSTFISYDGSIAIPPGAVGHVETTTCALPAGMQFWTLSTYAHKQATRTRLLDGATTLFESTDFAHPGADTHSSPPFASFATNQLTTECTYTNPTNRTITAGEDPQVDEQCVGLGYFFPATVSKGCFNGFVF